MPCWQQTEKPNKKPSILVKYVDCFLINELLFYRKFTLTYLDVHIFHQSQKSWKSYIFLKHNFASALNYPKWYYIIDKTILTEYIACLSWYWLNPPVKCFVAFHKNINLKYIRHLKVIFFCWYSFELLSVCYKGARYTCSSLTCMETDYTFIILHFVVRCSH